MNLPYEEITKLKDLKQFFSERNIPQKIICITGHGGEGKSSVSSKVGNKMPAYVENLDRHVFAFHKDHTDRVSEIVNAPLTADIVNNPKKLMKFHIANVCKDKETFSNYLKEVGPYAENKLCQNILKMRKGALQGNDTSWENSDFQIPDISTVVVDGATLWSDIGKQADNVFQIATSRPELSNLFIAKRQGIFVPKELEKVLYTGASLADAKKQGIQVPYELDNFLQAMETANDAAAELRQKTLRTLNYTQLVNKTVMNENDEKTDKEMKVEINAELECLSNKIVELSR